jgi:hypothetical protein
LFSGPLLLPDHRRLLHHVAGAQVVRLRPASFESWTYFQEIIAITPWWFRSRDGRHAVLTSFSRWSYFQLIMRPSHWIASHRRRPEPLGLRGGRAYFQLIIDPSSQGISGPILIGRGTGRNDVR